MLHRLEVRWANLWGWWVWGWLVQGLCLGLGVGACCTLVSRGLRFCRYGVGGLGIGHGLGRGCRYGNGRVAAIPDSGATKWQILGFVGGLVGRGLCVSVWGWCSWGWSVHIGQMPDSGVGCQGGTRSMPDTSVGWAVRKASWPGKECWPILGHEPGAGNQWLKRHRICCCCCCCWWWWCCSSSSCCCCCCCCCRRRRSLLLSSSLLFLVLSSWWVVLVGLGVVD